LEDHSGKNNGSVKSQRYLDYEMGRGMFVRLAAVTSILEDAPPPAAKPAPVKKAAWPSSVTGAGLRRASGAPDPVVRKRISMNAASPSPTGKDLVLRVCF
jgi:dynactin 1